MENTCFRRGCPKTQSRVFVTTSSKAMIRSKCFYPSPFFNLEIAVGNSNNCRLAAGGFLLGGRLQRKSFQAVPLQMLFFPKAKSRVSLSSQPPYFPQFYCSSEGQFVHWALVLFVGALRRVREDVKWNPLITSQAIRDNCEGRTRKTSREGEWVSRKGERGVGGWEKRVEGEQIK